MMASAGFRSHEFAAESHEATDQVVPVPYCDALRPLQGWLIHVMLVFEDVLDCQKLRDSLEALIEMDGWRKLGARLRRSSKGQLNYHIPSRFTKDRPALRHPAVVAHSEDFQSLSRAPGSPTTLNDYLKNDYPQLGLHIVTFTDATIVTLQWPHTLFDLMGQKAVLDAWTLILQGRRDEVPPTYAADCDPLFFNDTATTENRLLKSYNIN
ncbi:hypothetical protein CDD83_9695 [Cordyceps sp. RAO-2017]|nr:hypothetical protein CDD83_9695 [Cordyceps sp. RAO-2017]